MGKIIFGFVGQMASGKDTAADYLKEKYGSVTYSFSDMLKDALNRFHLEYNRDNLIKMSEIIRGTFGENIMAKTMGKDVEKETANIISIPNVRRMADIEFLSKNPGFVLIHLDADIKIRYERLLKRGEKADDSTKTFEEFLADHKRSTEMSIAEVASHAIEKINNDGSFEELYSQLDKLVEKYESKN